MTKINKMVMNGFKSFAKFTEIEFGDKYNCVLGPNGAGKSNILDALCFVLGKAGSKSLRAEKSANLIYNGGKSKNPSKKGEVSIFFDNKDKTFPTEEDEVKVTRIIRPNGQSIYKINDKARTRQEILGLLSLAKIEPDGYNIILQGDIVRFCEMGSIDRRLLIEEISGISIYEDRKNKAVSHLNKVDERLKEAEIILSERNTYLRELKKDRDQALKFQEMNANIRKYKATLLKIQIDGKESIVKEIKGKIEANNKILTTSQEKVKKIRSQIDEKKSTIEEISQEIERKGETDQVNLNREIENIKIELTKKSSKIDSLKSEITKVKERKKDLATEDEEIKKKIDELEMQKKEHIQTKKDKEKNRDEYVEKIRKFKEKNKLEVAGDIEKRIEEIEKETEELEKEINLMRETQHNLLREKDKLEHEIAIIDESWAKVKEVAKEHKKDLENLQDKRTQFKKTTLNLNKLLDEDGHLAAKIGKSRDDIHNESETLAKLNAQDAHIKELTFADSATKAVLKNKTPGIFGTVSELGTVNAKYSTALEIAGGSRLRSIVVEDDKIASDKINYLRKNKLGIASFIPINKIRAKFLRESEIKLLKAKGVQGLATDLINHDIKFKKVFSYIYGDTLIVDNMETARRIGIGQVKMITLEGDLAEKSGIMRGGYRDKKRRGPSFGIKELSKDLQIQNKKLADLKSSVLAFESRRKEVEKEIEKLRTKKGELEGEIIKSEKSLHLDDTDINLSEKKKHDLEKDLVTVESEINDFQNKISEKNKNLAKLKIERQQKRSQVSSIHNPVLIAELSTFEEKHREYKTDLVQLESEIKNIDVQIKDIFSPEVEKTHSIIKQLEKENSSFSDQISSLTKDFEKESKNLEGKEKEARTFYAKFKELFSKRGEINEQITKFEFDIAKENDKSRDTEIKNNTLSIKNAENSAGLQGLLTEFKEFEGTKLDSIKNEEQLKYQITRFEKMKNEIGNINMRALEIYEKIEAEYNKLLIKKDTLTQEKEDVESLMAEIEGKKIELFMKSYDSVNQEFQKIFLSLSKKGEAFLDLENKEDPFEEGIKIKVRLTGQKFLDIRSLSGGEKTLTALAFIFAIQEHDPAFFYILDEVDAALDKHNSEKLAKLIGEYSSRAQYIIISHNDAIISESSNLYGISMDEHGISKVVSLKV